MSSCFEPVDIQLEGEFQHEMNTFCMIESIFFLFNKTKVIMSFPESLSQQFIY